jgi:N6-L-threonylcarbamoyladenine synthase
MGLERPFYILAIESSCDDTAAAVLNCDKLLANVVNSQEVHRKWGGVVPELASRAHQQQIIPVVHAALNDAKISKEKLRAVAFTQGPGLPGSLLVGAMFAQAFAKGLNIPAVGVNHMKAHVLAHLIDEGQPIPDFPFICLTVSGGHTQLLRVDSPIHMKVLGETIDDAAGEAFDKVAKMLKLPYPGGPEIDRLAQHGNPLAFNFPEPKADRFSFSFSGLKTSVLYLIQREQQRNPKFLETHRADLAASVQKTIVSILVKKLEVAAQSCGIQRIALAGGVSANSELRKQLEILRQKGYEVFIPPFAYCTDNAAMIGVTAWHMLLNGYSPNEIVLPRSRWSIED